MKIIWEREDIQRYKERERQREEKRGREREKKKENIIRTLKINSCCTESRIEGDCDSGIVVTS